MAAVATCAGVVVWGAEVVEGELHPTAASKRDKESDFFIELIGKKLEQLIGALNALVNCWQHSIRGLLL